MPAAVANTASTVRDATVRAVEAAKIPVALAAIAATSQSVSSSVQQTLTRTGKSPAFGVVMIACLLYPSVDGAAAPPFPLAKSTVHDAAITPVAAVARASTDPTGPLVVAVEHPKVEIGRAHV